MIDGRLVIDDCIMDSIVVFLFSEVDQISISCLRIPLSFFEQLFQKTRVLGHAHNPKLYRRWRIEDLDPPHPVFGSFPSERNYIIVNIQS
jgi:hypothetical protein